jgi:serine/threonine protein kinase
VPEDGKVLIGRVFDDRYEVIKKLGSGGMADVFLAQDRLLGRQVALKILSSRYANDEQFIERFRREASSAASLNHPNIVQIYDRGEAEGTYYIAMEYLEGRSLKEIILKYAPLSPDLVVSVSVQILEALRFAHRRDVIHRDIKPQNMIIDNEGRVKVTDFGIARAGSASTMTEAGSILGTAHYLSPEQAQGRCRTGLQRRSFRAVRSAGADQLLGSDPGQGPQGRRREADRQHGDPAGGC